MNSDHFKGKWNQLKGELKKQWGAFTDDDLLTIEGDDDKVKGLMQETCAVRKEEVTRWIIDDWRRAEQPPDQASRAPRPVRENGRV